MLVLIWATLLFSPEVTIPPLTEGQQTTLTCTAPGLCSGSDPQITWTLSAVTQKHSSNLTFNPSAEHHGTSVTCKVSFTGNAATEETVTLNVTYPSNTVVDCVSGNENGEAKMNLNIQKNSITQGGTCSQPQHCYHRPLLYDVFMTYFTSFVQTHIGQAFACI
uniref:Ig-like domain-containing protein n=1 Tax=Seriola dumerili TaxID=41447 RepID=A0A3B4UD90_SERDU